MEKTQNVQASVLVKKVKNDDEKILFSLNKKTILQLISGFVFSAGSVFAAMFPFGIAFYSSAFKREKWLLSYVVAVVSVMIFVPYEKLVYIAAITLLTILLGVLDISKLKFKSCIFSSLSFLAVKLTLVCLEGINIYNIFEAVAESGLIFIFTFVFEKSFPLVISLESRNYISTTESVCTMAFFAVLSLSFAEFEPVLGFNIANVLSVLMIYIFSLGGLSGGAMILGVMLGTVGALKAGSFSDITSSFSFGALLGSALYSHGRVAIVLGFLIANTSAAFILSDSVNVAIGIYDSIAAAVIFFLLPQKACNHISLLFKKSAACTMDNNRVYTRLGVLTQKRLEQMSKNYHELGRIYSLQNKKREFGKDYIMSKFNEVINLSCTACPSKSYCFKTKESIGYRHMSKMLNTAFKTGKITAFNLPAEFKNHCRRSSSFADNFNNVFKVIHTEKLWMTKLDECRRLVSQQLEAVAESLESESNHCQMHIDTAIEEALWAEFDKTNIYPLKIVAERYPGGDFCISVYFSGKEHSNKALLTKVHSCVSSVMNSNLAYSYPVACGGEYLYRFFPSKKFTVTTGSAAKNKSNEKISGDTFRLINNDGNKINVILCDGMGSGVMAANESTLVAELMEKFINSGVASTTAVKLVNSSLLLRSMRDSFSTIDLCCVNLNDAEYEFTKLGAAKSYVKYGNKISCINGGSLPAGILKEIEVETSLFPLETNTIIVLMSDGVADIELKIPKHEGWIEKELLQMKTSNPQLIASRLIECASKLLQDNIHDDMTVVVLSIQKNS